MDSLPHDDSLLPIRCPQCGQRFKVDAGLMGRTVECGSCEHRFKIEDEVIVHGRKFYPGEKKQTSLDIFQRVQPPEGGASVKAPSSVLSVIYGKKPDPAWIEPMSPQRLLAGLAGGGLIVIIGLLLLFGGVRGGPLDGMTLDKRLMMAGFATLLGGILLIYANPKARLKAIFVSLLMGGVLIGLPFFVKGLPSAHDAEVAADEYEEAPTRGGARDDGNAKAVAQMIGLAPLEKEKARLAGLGRESSVIGLWLRNLPASNSYLIKDYVIRVTGADKMNSALFPRQSGDFLMVLSDVKVSLPEAARLVAPFGQVEAVHQDIGLVQIHVDNEKFVAGAEDKLINTKDPAFYELNKRELESIDLLRIERAVQRLGAAEPKVYRADVTRRLISLLNQDGVTFYPELCRALMVWSEVPEEVGPEALKTLERLDSEAKVIPLELVKLLAKEKVTRAIPIIHRLWLHDATHWESTYAEMGPSIEPALLAEYPGTEGFIRYSATRLLGQVGTPASLPELEAAKKGANRELQILIDDSIQRIKDRAAK